MANTEIYKSIFFTFLHRSTELNSVKCEAVRPSVRPSRDVQICTASKQLDLDAPSFFLHLRVDIVRPPSSFIQIVNVFYLRIEVDRFESSTLVKFMIISQTVTAILQHFANT